MALGVWQLWAFCGFLLVSMALWQAQVAIHRVDQESKDRVADVAQEEIDRQSHICQESFDAREASRLKDIGIITGLIILNPSTTKAQKDEAIVIITQVVNDQYDALPPPATCAGIQPWETPRAEGT